MIRKPVGNMNAHSPIPPTSRDEMAEPARLSFVRAHSAESATRRLPRRGSSAPFASPHRRPILTIELPPPEDDVKIATVDYDAKYDDTVTNNSHPHSPILHPSGVHLGVSTDEDVVISSEDEEDELEVAMAAVAASAGDSSLLDVQHLYAELSRARLRNTVQAERIEQLERELQRSKENNVLSLGSLEEVSNPKALLDKLEQLLLADAQQVPRPPQHVQHPREYKAAFKLQQITLRAKQLETLAVRARKMVNDAVQELSDLRASRIKGIATQVQEDYESSVGVAHPRTPPVPSTPPKPDPRLNRSHSLAVDKVSDLLGTKTPTPPSSPPSGVKHIFQQLLNSEETYADRLALLLRFYVRPLTAAAEQSNDAPAKFDLPAPLSRLFCIVEGIANFHQLFRKSVRRSSRDPGRPFIDNMDFFHTYADYATSYEEVFAALADMERDENFQAFLLSAQSQPEVKKLTLVQLLITPMERIIRYDALLKALRRQLCVASGKTPSDELTDSDLDRAYATIHKIAVGAQRRRQLGENLAIVLNINDKISALVRSLLNPWRNGVLRFGMLSKKGSFGRHKTYHYILFSDSLLETSLTSWRFKHHWMLSRTPGQPLTKGTAKVKASAERDIELSMADGTSVVLTARDQRSRDGWVTDIQKAISTSQARLGVARHLMGRGSILALKASPDTSTDSADSLPGQVQVTKPSSDDEPEDKTAAPVRRRLQSLKLNSRQDYQHREPVMDLALE